MKEEMRMRNQTVNIFSTIIRFPNNIVMAILGIAIIIKLIWNKA